MFEALQFLIRIQEALGEDSVVSIGKGVENMAMISVTWKGGNEDFTCQLAILSNVVSSSLSDTMMEQMIVQRLTNEHKMWEVGEI